MPPDQSQAQSQALAALSGFALIGGIIGIALLVFSIIIYWRIFSKAGYNGALTLLILIPLIGPIIGLILMCVLAFGEWPIYRELNQLRQQAMARPPQYPPQYPQAPQYR